LSVDRAIALFYWPRFLGLAALPAVAIYRARRRWLDAEPDSQAKRIIFPWLSILFGFAVFMGLLSIFLLPWLIFYLAAIVSLWIALPALASIAVLDLGARLARARRTAFWLAAGIVAYVAVTALWLVWLGGGEMPAVALFWLDYLAVAAIPVTAAIIWWSYLPGGSGGDAVARTFD